MGSINEKLTRIDNNISSLKNTLGISQDAKIETIEEKIIPKKGFIINEWDDNGNAINITYYGNYPTFAFAMGNTSVSENDCFIRALKNITINEANSYARWGFYKNTSLESVNFINCTENILFNSQSFYGCTNLKTVNLPPCRTLAAETFYNCTSLELSSLPSEIKTIQTNAFENCKKITIKSLPYVTHIDNAFRTCTALTQMSLKNIEIVYSGGFYNCTGLRCMWLGPKYKGTSQSFLNCINLKKIYIDQPRATVETSQGYSVKWGAANAIIICNDDEGFITQEEFDAIDWSSVE